MIDEPEKIEMKVEKHPKIKLRSLPAAATAFIYFSLPRLLLLVLRRYSSCFLFQWLWQIYKYGSLKAEQVEAEHVGRIEAK